MEDKRKAAAAAATSINSKSEFTENIGASQESPASCGEDMPTAVYEGVDINSDSIVDDIRSEVRKAASTTNSGILTIKTANQTIKDVLERPEPVKLYDELWCEGETCCLYADSNVGKSVFAVQMADTISRTRPVLYVDFELSEYQFAKRYADRNGNMHLFSDNFKRAYINPDRITDMAGDFEGAILNNIESTAKAGDFKVIIIDNLTYLCNNSEKGLDAGNFMIRLLNLKKRHGWSMLVLAHTPKRDLTRPITQNDLAGSKKLYNLFDSAFTIGQSAKGQALRYIKQTKVRSSEFTYTSEHVAVYSLEYTQNWLHFEFMEYGVEDDHLRKFTGAEMAQKAVSLKDSGLSYAKIGRALGISHGKAYYLIKNFAGNPISEPDSPNNAGGGGIQSSIQSDVMEGLEKLDGGKSGDDNGRLWDSEEKTPPKKE